MDLMAYIDPQGDVYICKYGHWSYFNLRLEDDTVVTNEDGGLKVDIEDINRAFCEHEPYGKYAFFSTPEVQAFVNSQ